MIHLAYDGSVHGDWVAHYAIRLAAHSAPRRLRAVVVDNWGFAGGNREERLARIAAECHRAGVAFESTVLESRTTVADVLRDAIPHGAESFAVCGTRVRPRAVGFLRGTVTEQLMRDGPFNVLAIHVAQPGLIGVPRSVALPVAGHPRGLSAALPFLRLLAPDVTNLHILLVKAISSFRLRPMSRGQVDRLHASGEVFVREIEEQLSQEASLRGISCDAGVAISSDVAREIVNHANRTKSRLIFMGASERSWTERLVSAGPIEQVLAATSSDVAIYRGVR